MVLYVYTPEVYPTSVRGTAMGYCSSVARIGAIVTPFVAQVCPANCHTKLTDAALHVCSDEPLALTDVLQQWTPLKVPTVLPFASQLLNSTPCYYIAHALSGPINTEASV